MSAREDDRAMSAREDDRATSAREDDRAASGRGRSDASPKRLLDYLNLAREYLEAKGIDNARLDCELMLAEVLGLTRIELYTNHDRPLAAGEVTAFRELLRRRAGREPVAYILGRREFWSLELEVDRRVLIPRPETELLVEQALRALSGQLANIAQSSEQGDESSVVHGRERQPSPSESLERRSPGLSGRVLDVGTGSGAIAVALAVEGDALELVATDCSHASLEIAPRNAEKHGVAARIEFRQGDLFEPIDAGERFDLIVSNPPYCKQAELAQMEPEVRSWEPTPALVSGEDGMTTTRRMIDAAPSHLQRDGWLLVEVGTQAADVRRHFAERGWREIATFKDLAGHDRVVAARPPLA
jgi:release factor glutamine methyltransferase